MTTSRTKAIAAAMALTATAGFALAQPPANDHDLLRGPRVTDTHVPGAQDAFAGRPMAGAEGRPEERPITMLMFVRTVRSLDDPGIDSELNLNEGQRAVIEVMQRESGDALKAWRDEHKAEIREFRGSMRPGDKSRGRRAASAPARGELQPRPGQPIDRRLSDGEQAERLDTRAPRQGQGQQGKRSRKSRPQLDENAKAQLKAIMETRPSAETQQSQIWEILTPEQQAFVESEFDRKRADDLATREMKRQRKQDSKARAANKRDRSQRRQRPALRDGETTDQFQQRMLERIEQLPTEHQEKALNRLNKALKRMEQPAGSQNSL